MMRSIENANGSRITRGGNVGTKLPKVLLAFSLAVSVESNVLAQEVKPPTPARATSAECADARQDLKSQVARVLNGPTKSAVEKEREVAIAKRKEIVTCLSHTPNEPEEVNAEIKALSHEAIEGAVHHAQARLLDTRACERSKEVIARTKNGQFQSARALLHCEFHDAQECFDNDGNKIPASHPAINSELRGLKGVAETAAADVVFTAKVAKIEKCVADAEAELDKKETEFFESTPCGLDDSPNRSSAIRKKTYCFVLGVMPATLSFVRVEKAGSFRGSASTELVSVAVPYAGLRINPFQRLRVLSFELIAYSAYLTSAGVRNAVSGNSKSCSTAGSTFEASLGCQGEASVAPYIGIAPSISIGERNLGYVSWFPITGGLARVGTDDFRTAWYWGTLIGIVSLNRTF